MKKSLLTFALLLSPVFVISSCGCNNNNPTPNDNYYKVTFYAERGYFSIGGGKTSKTLEIQVEKGKTVDRPLDPNIDNEDYEFDTWYQDTGTTIKFDFTAPISKDTDVYAKYNFVGEEPFYFEIAGGEEDIGAIATISFSTYDSEINPIHFEDIQYYVGTSYEYAEWIYYDGEDTPITFSIGEKLYIKSYQTSWNTIKLTYTPLEGDLGFNIGGNIMSLLNPDDFKNMKAFQAQEVFNGFFASNQFTPTHNGDYLRDASSLKLPATTLSRSCYNNMFRGSGVTTLPKTIGDGEILDFPELACYEMFRDCDNLVPNFNGFINANNLNDYAFYEMFRGCSKLTSVDGLVIGARDGIIGEHACDGMFSSTIIETINDIGTLLPSINLSSYCYSNMFADCKYLPGSQEIGLKHVYGQLPAMTLASNCYSNMFNGCMILEDVDENLLPATNLAEWCYSGMFLLCQRHFTKAPYLPYAFDDPETYINYRGCYNSMFAMCQNILELHVGFAQFPNEPTRYTSSWLVGDIEAGTTPVGSTDSKFIWRGSEISTYGTDTVPDFWQVISELD